MGAGRFELAHKGTLFLDEVGTLPLNMQIKLLQVLQEGRFTRVGGETERTVDVRVVAATNEDLPELTGRGAFRKDLFYRLNVFPIPIPPLRERLEDIPFLCSVFIHRLNHGEQKHIQGIDEDVLDAFRGYDWPGNIRELENVLERAFILESTPSLSVSSFPLEILRAGGNALAMPIDPHETLAQGRRRVVKQYEREYLQEVLRRCGGRMSRAATAAGIGVRQLHKMMTRYGLNRKDFCDASGRSSGPSP